MKTGRLAVAAPRRLGPWIIAASVLVLAALVALVSVRLRGSLREQVLSREAESVHALVALQQRLAEDEWAELGVSMPSEDRLAVVLQTTKLRGVVAVRIYEPTGLLHAAVPAVADEALMPTDWSALEQGRPVARLTTHSSLLAEWSAESGTRGASDGSAVSGMNDEARLAEAVSDGPELLEVIVPLEDPLLPELAGAAQFLVDPSPVRLQFAAIDRGVVQQAVLATVAGGLLLGVLLAWAFARLETAERQLQRQAEDLRRANDELLLSAKVSAIGAISAHLLHGLRNPLAGIDGFVKAGASGDGPDAADGDAWREAAETTRRLRAMVNEATALIAAERTAGAPDLSADDVVRGAVARTAESARRAGVAVQVGKVGVGELDGRVASLGGLVLVNLIENAVQASPRGAEVSVTGVSVATGIAFDVVDRGPGLVPSIRENLFRPVASTKPGGGGIGLALSHELARLAGGTLELVSTSASGTTFRLTLPRAGAGKR